LLGELQDHFTFADALGATRAEIGAAMRGVENHDVQADAGRQLRISPGPL
jgi:hypothetical protein